MENISNLIVTAVAVIGAITAALIGGLTIWTFRDIRSRSRDILVQILATVMVGVIPIAGILVYFMLRPRETLAEGYVRALEEESLLASIEHQEFCPSCGRRVDGDMVYCPGCHTKLRNPCPNCHRAVHLSWDLCPYCGETLQPEMPVIRKPARRPITQAPPKTSAPLSPTASQPTATLSAAGNDGLASHTFTNVLDKVGGAIEGLVDRLSSHGPNGAQSEEDLQDPRLLQRPPQPSRRPTQTFVRSQATSDGNSDGTTKSSTGAIKPLISREEPLE
jgi:RNA polymerase subunit RPABC4/transcription elongation factor Spt4